MTSDIRPVALANAPKLCGKDHFEASQEDIGHQQSWPIFMDIDYSLDVQQTYQTFASAFAAAGRLAAILNAVLARQHSPTPSNWPSWVPDWRLQPTTTISLPLTAVSLIRSISKTCLEVRVHSPQYWSDESRKSYCFDVDSITLSSRETAERLISYMVVLYKTACPINDDNEIDPEIEPSGLATVVKSLWPLMRDVDLDLLTNCLTRLWDNATLLDSNFLVQHDKRLGRQLQEALRGQCFFIASISAVVPEVNNTATEALVMRGFGNAAMRPGDKVFPISKQDRRRYVGHSAEHKDAIIMRPSGRSPAGETVYRLIGSAYVFPVVYIHSRLMQPKRGAETRILLE
jgi:hypothetical protein